MIIIPMFMTRRLINMIQFKTVPPLCLGISLKSNALEAFSGCGVEAINLIYLKGRIAQLPSSLHQSPDDPSANAFCAAAFVPDDDGKVVLPEGNVPDGAVSLIFFDLYEI